MIIILGWIIPVATCGSIAVAPGDDSPSMNPGMVFEGTSQRGRVLELYDLDAVANHVSGDAAEKLANQTRMDAQNDLFTPLPNLIHQYTPLGDIELGRVLFRGYESVIYTIKELPDYLIKFQANCDELRNAIHDKEHVLHPLLPDYWYAKEAFSNGLAIEPIFLSPPSFLCKNKTGKCGFDMTDQEFDTCSERRGTIRYMIMKRSLGMNLMEAKRSHPIGHFSFVDSLAIGVSLFRMLEKLHQQVGVVHGDIYASNVMMVPAAKGGYSLRLIDFGRAFRNMQKSNSRKFEVGRFEYFLFSFWQSEGMQWAARDDLIKTLQLMAQLMNPDEYFVFEKFIMNKGHATQWKFKREAFIFEIPPGIPGIDSYDPIDLLGISEDAKDAIRQRLAGVLHLVRSLDDINQVPLYSRIISELQECRNLALSH